MYDLDLTNTSKGALVELCRALSDYKEHIVLAGGWAPYFLTEGFFDHCGSIDIDLVLRPEVVERYERIKGIIERIGYTQTGSVFRFVKEFISPSTESPVEVELDFLTEPEGAIRLSSEWFHSVQSDLVACIIPGSSIVFNHRWEKEITAVIPDRGEAFGSLYIVDIVGILSMKGQCLHRMKDKDSYDIYAVAGYLGGSPTAAVDAFNGVVGVEPESIVLDSMEKIKRDFMHPESVGCVSVARFIGDQTVRYDAWERLNTFINNINL